MLSINRLREFLIEVKGAIPEIRYTQAIITNEEFVKFLKERKTTDNTMLFAVIPEHGLMGQEDKSKFTNYLQFFLVDKSATKDLKHDAKLDLFNKIQIIAKEFIAYILTQKSDDDSCGIFEYFNEDSVEIKVFWDGFECRGYEILFQLETKM
jgi:hypothetical protein